MKPKKGKEWEDRLMSEPPGGRGQSQVDAGLERVSRRVMFTEGTGPGL